MRAVIAGLALFGVVVVACGGGDSESTPPTNTPAEATIAHSEDALAESLLLTIADFPTGWTETPDDESDDGDSSGLDKCSVKEKLSGGTGTASTGDFSKGNSGSVTQLVAVYATDEAAKAATPALESFFDCLVRVINDGAMNTDDVKFKDATRGVLSMPSIGEQMSASRITFEGKQNGVNLTIDAYIDLITVRQGRFVTFMFAFDVISPFPPETLADVTAKAVAKLPRN